MPVFMNAMSRLVSFLAISTLVFSLGACGGEADEPLPPDPQVPSEPGGEGDGPGEPAPLPVVDVENLPPCPGAADSYMKAGSKFDSYSWTTLEYFGGPVISLQVSGADVVVLSAEGVDHDPGLVELPSASWNAEICVGWNGASCANRLVPYEGGINFYELVFGDLNYFRTEGNVSGYFVDDADEPTCSAYVYAEFAKTHSADL